MFTLPLASISVHKFIDNVGAYVGFASIIAVALLVLLYFAHARETATLRDRLDEAHARIGGLEQRIQQLMQAGRGRPPVPGLPPQPPMNAPAPAPAPAGATIPPGTRPAGAVIPSVRRLPAAATPAGATAVAPPPPLAGATRNGIAPFAPAGMGGPALASATTSVPATTTPKPAAAPSGEDTMFVAPTTNGDGVAKAPATVAAAAAPRPTATPRAATPPPVKIGGTGSARTRRTPPSSRSLLDDLAPAGANRRLSGRVLPLLIGGIAVVVIIVGLIVITNSGSGTSTGVVSHPSTGNQTGASVTNKKKTKPAAPFEASRYRVSVLNGTAVSGLAADAGKVITAGRFKLGNVSNAASQTQTSTFVYYVSGASTATNRIAAQHVATKLKLPSSRVRAAGPSVLTSCATSETGAALGGCKANVVVSVGTDRADLASSSSST